MSRILRRAAALLLSALVVTGVAAVALVMTGRASLVITHGISMNPVCYQGDLVVVTRRSSYHAGDIVAYRRPGRTDVVLHRIIGGDPTGWVFKGDNNASPDPTRPTDSQLVGRAFWHVSHGGLWLRRLTSRPGLAAITLLFLLTGSPRQSANVHRRRRAMSRHAARSSPRSLPAPAGRLATAATLAIVGVAGLALAGAAWSVPTASTATVQSVARTITFSYSAAVPRTAAYDSTAVTAPQPVFRKLTHLVDVTYTVPGDLVAVPDPGVQLTLTSGSGWSSTQHVPVRLAYTAHDAVGTVRLDLNALEARSRAAAAVTGLPSDTLTIAIAPRLSDHRAAERSAAATNRPVAASWSLTLTALTLKPAEGSEARITLPVAPARAEKVPRSLHLAGHPLPVRTARLAAGVLLLVGAAGAALVLGGARGRGGDGAWLRRRHGQLLVEVAPVPMPLDRVYVDVRSAATLARIAERYGAMILHWTRSDVQTFLVQDQDVTFRFRSSRTVQIPPSHRRDLTACEPHVAGDAEAHAPLSHVGVTHAG
jgi:signal peptidase I